MKKVLLVEDDVGIREALAELLNDEGYELQLAANGAEAMAFLNDASALPDAILLDLTMPVMDGYELTDRLAADSRLAPIPVIVFSASSTFKRELTHATRIIRKPIDVHELLSTILQVCS